MKNLIPIFMVGALVAITNPIYGDTGGAAVALKGINNTGSPIDIKFVNRQGPGNAKTKICVNHNPGNSVDACPGGGLAGVQSINPNQFGFIHYVNTVSNSDSPANQSAITIYLAPDDSTLQKLCTITFNHSYVVSDNRFVTNTVSIDAFSENYGSCSFDQGGNDTSLVNQTQTPYTDAKISSPLYITVY